MGRKFKDLTGVRFGRLTAVRKTDRSGKGTGYFWECLCDCGNISFIGASTLLSGTTRSCGCLKAELASERMLNTIAKPLSPGEASFNNIYLSYKARARKSGIVFELARETFKSIIVLDCTYCGAAPEERIRGSHYGGFVCNGVDRFYNNIGYTVENSVSCCARCNMAKGTMSGLEFLEFINSVYNHSIRKQQHVKHIQDDM